MSAVTDNEPRTYRGNDLDELLPKIREELGSDAIVLRQRDGLDGGIGGFFQRRCVEVVARRAAPRVNHYDEGGLAVAPEPPAPAIQAVRRAAAGRAGARGGAGGARTVRPRIPTAGPGARFAPGDRAARAAAGGRAARAGPRGRAARAGPRGGGARAGPRGRAARAGLRCR
jgi:hypothetical protein